jgi:ELWxxDGT repeat protein
MVKKLLYLFHSLSNRKWQTALVTHVLAFLCLLTSTSHAQTTLFADINKTGSSTLQGPLSELVYANGLAFFINDNNVWRTDGTSLGTYKLVEQVSMSNVRQLTSCGDRIYFVADYYDGSYLWVSYGNYATVMNGGGMVFPKSPDNLFNVNGTLYFSATDPTYGREVWKAYGDYRDVVRVSDILRGVGSSNPTEFQNIGNTVYFTANDGSTGYELWKTDGTSAGTVMVKDVRTGTKLSSTPKQLTNVNGVLYFTAYDETHGRELWKSNGTPAGTLFVKDIRVGSAESIPDNLTAVGSTLYFGANNGTNGRELWKSNGTAAGTVLVKDITVGSGSNAGGGYPHLSYFTVFNGRLYFMAYTDRPRLWRSDGTSAGTIPITPLDRHFVGINPNVTVFNGSLYYVTNDNVEPDRGTMEIWKTDGTPSNHQQVRSNLGVWQNTDMELTPAENRMYFTTWVTSDGMQEKLWYTDGTAAGTVEVQVEANSGSSAPANLTTMGAAIYFSAWNGTQHGLFKTDGTVAGTVIVKEIDGELSDFYTSNGLLYFIQATSQDVWSSQRALWRSDGTSAGTFLLSILGMENNVVDGYDFDAISNGNVFLMFNNTLWKTDGTAAGTLALKTFPNPIGWIANSGEELLFAANDGVKGMELWRSNGTVAGTVLQRDIFPGSSSSLLSDSFSEPTSRASVTLDNVVYFLANAGGDANFELWRSDGTNTGTRMLKNDETGKPFTPLNSLAIAGGELFLFTYEGYQGGTYIEKRTLWKSDGTTTGTVPIYELLHDDATGSLQLHLFGGGAHLYFLTTVYLDPATMYASNGTPEGTEIVYQFGDMESAGPTHVAFDGQKTYISSGHMYDKFVLRSDGTACGTNHVPFYTNGEYVDADDIWLAVLDHKLYLNSYQEQSGEELYRYTDNNYAPCATTVAQQTELSSTTEEQVVVNVYPNPSARMFTVNVPGVEGASYALEVTGPDGVVVESHHDLRYNATHEFGASWKGGIYIVKVRTDNTVTMRRLVKRDE